jgi:hypothetical protein
VANAIAVVVSILILVRSCETRRAALIVGLMPPIMLLQLLKTADPGPHHWYLLLPAYVLLPSLALAKVLGNARRLVRWLVVGLVAGAGATQMAVMFLPEARPLYPHLRPGVSRLYFPPIVKSDLPEFIRLLRATDEAAPTDTGRIAVVASSLTINPSMFATADLSLGQALLPSHKVLLTPEVDRVSGFPNGLFEADLVVVAWPPQTHLRPEEQQVIVLTAERLHHRTGIGKAFDRLPGEYHLAGGVTASLYVRARPVETCDLNELADRLREAHPNRPVLFTPQAGIERWLEKR